MRTGGRGNTRDRKVHTVWSAQPGGSRRRSRLHSTAGLVATGALGAVMLLASSQTSYAADSSPTPGMSSDMPGMDMGSGSPTPTPTPGMSSDMPGMDMGSGSAAPTPTPAATEAPIPGPDAGEMPGMDMSGSTGHQHGGSTGPAASRPLAPVLGTFGGGTVAVMLTAGMMRRKDREVLVAKKAMRAGRSGK